MEFHKDYYAIGDLVVFLQNVEWGDNLAIQYEIGIIIEIFEPSDEENFFDLNIQLGDGGTIPVWYAEVEKLEDAE